MQISFNMFSMPEWRLTYIDMTLKNIIWFSYKYDIIEDIDSKLQCTYQASPC